ncbi:MAG TPA: hypothetical protein VEE86_03225 [Thermoplasmata archaeon]|nr:hypothetical protein [Thermoplasmata archaeon]
MSPSPNAGVRRFAAFWAASTVWKLVALAVFLLLAVRLAEGGHL